MATQDAAEGPVCPGCGAGKAMRYGRRNGRQRFRCRGCGKLFVGVVREAVRYPCPYCDGDCWRDGLDEQRRQRYRCMRCGRYNTRLWPGRGQDMGGPFRHRLTFSLDGPAREGLAFGCRRWGRNAAQAVRHLLIVATEGAFLPDVEEAEAITAGRGEWTDVYGNRGRGPTVASGVERVCVTVLLNDRALQGLAWTMSTYNLTRQEAVRWLLRRVRRGDTFTPTRSLVRRGDNGSDEDG